MHINMNKTIFELGLLTQDIYSKHLFFHRFISADGHAYRSLWQKYLTCTSFDQFCEYGHDRMEFINDFNRVALARRMSGSPAIDYTKLYSIHPRKIAFDRDERRMILFCADVCLFDDTSIFGIAS